MKSLMALLLMTLSLYSCAATKIYSFKENREMTFEELKSEISLNDHIVLGEYHYDKEIQKIQATIIDQVATVLSPKENELTVGWEFLLYKDQKKLDLLFKDYVVQNNSGEKLLKEMLGEKNLEMNKSYLPIFEAARKHNAKFIALNEDRKIKRIITKEGINKLPAKYLPPQYERGGKEYFERFKKAMGGHAKPETLNRYFDAQSFTDSVMAYQYSKNSAPGLKFTIVGSFHTDYNDAYIKELKKYTNDNIINIKVVNKKTLDDKSFEEFFNKRPYGPIADFLIYNE